MAEGRPVDVHERVLGVGGLPKQETRQACLARRTDHEIGVGQIGCVEVRCDAVRVDPTTQVISAVGHEFRDEVLHRVDDLLASTVGESDRHPPIAPRHPFLETLRRLLQIRRQQVEAPDETNADVGSAQRVRNLLEQFLENLVVRQQLLVGTSQVLLREQPARDGGDFEVVRPVKELDELRHPRPIRRLVVGEALTARIPPVAVVNDADVAREPVPVEGCEQPVLVEPVERTGRGVTDSHVLTMVGPIHRSTPGATACQHRTLHREEARTVAMSAEHKAAIAQGRRESRAIKAYLEAISVPKRRGRPVTPESLEARIADLDQRIRNESDPLARVDLYQARLDTQETLDQLAETVDIDALEAGFVEYAASYSTRKGITWPAWREAGISAAVLRAAGVKRTRRN